MRLIKSRFYLRGIYFIADFSKKFNSKTFLLPDHFEKLFGEMGRNFQKIKSDKGQLVTLENTEFENAFAVYGSDQLEARYILTPVLMERILKFRMEAKSPILLSFVNSSVNVAIPVKEDLFQAKIFSSAIKKEYLQRYCQYLQLAVDIIEELNLNNRIWTKA